MNLLDRISEVIARTEDRKQLRLLNRAYWREYFRLERNVSNSQLRKAA